MWTGIEGSSLRALDMVAIAGCPAVSSIVFCSSRAFKRLKMCTFIGLAWVTAIGCPIAIFPLASIALHLFLT